MNRMLYVQRKLFLPVEEIMNSFHYRSDFLLRSDRQLWLAILTFCFLGNVVMGQDVDFVRDVQPLLTKHCAKCHNAKQRESGLRIDHAADLLAGGDSGAAIVAGKSSESRLIIAVTGGNGEISKMPPDGNGLSPDEVALLKRWIDAGAATPQSELEAPIKSTHWSFQPVTRSKLPVVPNPVWTLTPIDAFVVARLTEKQLTPSLAADQATALRRLSLDLLGLPPTPADVTEFVEQTSPDVYERATDRLLASPAFGERWGRHWLDQARYADSNGYTRDFGRDIWLFREWVIRAINRDMPFDQFTQEQLAGDLLPGAATEQQVATGFHRNTLINEEGGTDQEQFRIEAVADRVATTGQVWLGLTLGCARCHNHKYDPISQREFYQLFAFLNNCDEPMIEAPSALNIERGDLERRTALREQAKALEQSLEQQRPELEAKQQEWEKTVTPEQRARLPGPVQIAYDMAFDKRDAANKKLIEDYYKQQTDARKAFPQLEEIAKLRDAEPKIPKTMVLKERSKPRVTNIHKRGDFLNLGVAVEPAVPAVLPPLSSSTPSAKPNRLDLARWLVDSRNPLTPRVTVNRHWQTLFGRGLVETDDDFGLQGNKPTHPELLDWLASEFVGANTDSAWSTKRLLRQIVTSAVYRQSSRTRPELNEVDPRNDWLARQNRLRVEAEIVRDMALAASGLLTREQGGPSVMPPQPDGVYAFTQDPKPWKAEVGGNRFRRGMYTFFWRSLPYPMLTTFDAPNANVTCTRRIRSNTPLQSLTMANDLAFLECAQSLATNILRESPPGIDGRIRYAFQLCLARKPASQEAERLAAFVQQQLSSFTNDEAATKQVASAAPPDLPPAELAAWIAAARVLLNLDEFITRE